jgi:hypothetical protein
MDALQIKKQLLELVKKILHRKISDFKKAMDSAQHDANQHKGAMESRYDTFKEEAQALRDGFALQLQRTSDTLAAIEQIELKRSTGVDSGAIIVTSEESYFVSTGLIDEPLEVNGVQYECVSPTAPVIQKLRKAGVNSSIEIAGRKLTFIRIL